MGLIAKFTEFLRRSQGGESYSEVMLAEDSGDAGAAQWCMPPGIDCQPHPDDQIASVKGEGVNIAFGSADTATEGEAASGEIQIYARDSSGVRVVRIQVFSDGSAKIWNDNGSLTLKPDGNVEASNDLHVMGALTVDGTADVTGEVTGNGIALSTHTHQYVNDIFTVPDGPSVPTPDETEPPS